jgi:aspartyl-tRNA synthetase
VVSQLSPLPDGPVTVAGWVETVRDQKKVQFVILRDESGAVQLVNPASRDLEDDATPEQQAAAALTETIGTLAHGTMVRVTGELKHDERVKLGGLEVKVGTLEVVSEAIAETPIAEDSSLDKRLDWRFLDLRRPEANLLFRVQTTFEHALRSFAVDTIDDAASAGRNQAADDDIFLQTDQIVGFPSHCGFGQHARRLLERSCGDK